MNSNRDDFPILSREINGKKLVYFDNAATSPKPQTVIDAISNHYQNHAGNPGRGTHTLSFEAAQVLQIAREKVLKLLNASGEVYEVIFTKNATESLNLSAHILKNCSSIITTVSEHHSNFLPWMRNSKNGGTPLSIVSVTESGAINMNELEKHASEFPKAVLAITHGSNVTGNITNLPEVVTIATKYSLTTVIDASQTIAHKAINLTETPIDFLAASAHKMYGPEGVGILVVKKSFVTNAEPLLLGGGSVDKVTSQEFVLKSDEGRFEAGTIHTSGIAGLIAAIDYIDTIGLFSIEQKESELLEYFRNKAAEVAEMRLLGGNRPTTGRTPIIAFTLSNIHPHDVADFLDSEGIAVRAGFHCAEPLHTALNSGATVRVSLAFFNETSEIDTFFNAIQKCLQKYA